MIKRMEQCFRVLKWRLHAKKKYSEVMEKFDLERRTKFFALNVRSFVRRLPRTHLNVSDIKQVVRSSGSVAANYIEANNSLSRADFLIESKYVERRPEKRLYGLNYWLLIQMFL